MKLFRVAIPILMLILPALGQTTYTTTADGCGAKNLGYCRLFVTDQNSAPFDLILDHRNNSQGPMETLTVNYPYPGPNVFTVHGAFSGFVADPTWDRKAHHLGSGSFLSDDQKVSGQFDFEAYYVGTCSGRGCAGTVVGWHYRVLSGSTVTVQ